MLKFGPKFFFDTNTKSLCLLFDVSEKEILAKREGFNGEVWKDSCVEFFVSFDKREYYYNFEINPIGAIHAAYGKSRYKRDYILEDELSKIEVITSYEKKTFGLKKGDFKWRVILIIPLSVFVFTKFENKKIKKMWGNFYKCGDELSKPHYISAFKIFTDKPDFHQPSFFKKIRFKTA
jgi:hypothetical protein